MAPLIDARAKGKARIEGKDYVMADGDVVEFRFTSRLRWSECCPAADLP